MDFANLGGALAQARADIAAMLTDAAATRDDISHQVMDVDDSAGLVLATLRFSTLALDSRSTLGGRRI